MITKIISEIGRLCSKSMIQKIMRVTIRHDNDRSFKQEVPVRMPGIKLTHEERRIPGYLWDTG